MKKIVMSVVAVCFAFCMVSAAEALKINGDFKNVNPKNPIPTNWIKNGNGFKDASISIVKEGDKNILKFASKGKHTAIFTASTHKCADNAKFEITLLAKGKADEFNAGVYTYGAKNTYLAIRSAAFKIDSPDKFTEYKKVITLTPVKAGKTEYIRGFIGAMSKPFDVQIKEVKIVPVDAK